MPEPITAEGDCALVQYVARCLGRALGRHSLQPEAMVLVMERCFSHTRRTRRTSIADEVLLSDPGENRP